MPMYFPLAPVHLAALTALQLSLLLLAFRPDLALLPLLLFALVSAWATLRPTSRYYLPVLSRGSRREKAVSLTFDDGPDPLVTPRVLELLARRGLRATFFLVGRKAESYPELVRAILEAGHTLGNHSYSHFPFLMLKGRKAIRREVEAAQAVFRSFGVAPLAFRPPAGVTAPPLWPVLLRLGMFCVNFDCRAGDVGNRRIRNLAHRILKRVRPGSIVLLHDTAPAKESLDRLLGEFETLVEGLEARGLEIRPLASLLGREIMQSSGTTPEGHAAALFYDGLAATYDHEQFFTAVSMSRRAELALFEAALPRLFRKADHVLEIGAGTGIFTTRLAPHCGEVEALDISSNMLALLEAKCRDEGISNVRTRVGNAETLELGGPFDGVCAFSSLAYLEDLPAFLGRLAPRMKPGGVLYVLTARRSLFRFFTQVGNAMRQGIWLKAYSRRQMGRMLQEAGFEVVSIRSHLLKCVISGGMLLEVEAHRRSEA